MEEGDEDHDMNLIFRFDWVSDEDEEGVEYLDLFYIGQRKGIFRTVRIIVTKEEEPVIRKWLQPRYEKILQLWEPFSNAN
jgi:hypothetical protein